MGDKMKPGEWQPMQTLPRDGTVVIVTGGVAHWHAGELKTLTAEEYPGRPILWPVRWWMPIPDPPE